MVGVAAPPESEEALLILHALAADSALLVLLNSSSEASLSCATAGARSSETAAFTLSIEARNASATAFMIIASKISALLITHCSSYLATNSFMFIVRVSIIRYCSSILL